MKRTVVIDGDIVAYASAAAVEKPINWGDGLWTLHAFEQDAVDVMIKEIDFIFKETKANDLIIALSDPEHNFRKDILPSYKSNRANTRPPMLRRFCNGWLRDNYNVLQLPTLEADDVMGILCSSPNADIEYVIASKDKDLLTVPGLHFLPHQPDLGVFSVNEREANIKFMTQTLTGDTTDGYSGCPGIGAVTAEKLLSACATEVDMWDTVVATFEKKGLTKDDALVQANVARILRYDDYKFNGVGVRMFSGFTSANSQLGPSLG